MSAEETKTRTITLTDAQPVKIKDDEWPTIAVGKVRWHDGQIEAQANRRKSCSLRVRQHADGRVLVYGVYDFTSQFQGEPDINERAGVLFKGDDEDVVRAIKRIANTLTDLVEDEHFVQKAMRDCIADLPAVEI